MTSAGSDASIASARKIGSAPAEAPIGRPWVARSRQLFQWFRPGHRLQHAALGVESLQRAGVRSARFEQEDVLDQARHGRRGLRARQFERDGARRIAVGDAGLTVEGQIDLRQLAIERLREIGGARLQAGAHPRPLRLTDFADPAVLQRRQRHQQRGEHGSGNQLPRHARTVVKYGPHKITVRESSRQNRAFYISYKTIAQR